MFIETQAPGYNYINNVTVINEITNPVNWVGGIYVGSLDGMTAGNIYIDTNLNLRYEFDGTTLLRIDFNTHI